MIKALFCDVDKTILNNRYELPEKVVRAFASVTPNVRIILATARSPNGVLPVCKALNVEHAICFNGGWIGSPGSDQILREQTIDRPLALDIMRATRELGLSCLWYGKERVWTLDLNETVKREGEITSEIVFAADRPEELPDSPFKIMCSSAQVDDPRFDELRARFSGNCSVASSAKRLLEIVPGSVSKGSAAAWLADHLNISAQDCAAAGDAENDITMLRWAGNPVTVANAIPECRALAEFVGRSVEEGGMADVVEWLRHR